MNIDWSKAPEGATHFSPSCEDYFPCWCKWVDGCLFGWLLNGDSSWTRIRDQERNQEKIKAMISRPIAEKWNGEGLPPVGTVCEYLEDGNGDWEQVRIVAIDQHLGHTFAVYSGDKGYSGDRRAELFRPIRTPEQMDEDHLFRRISALSALHRLPMSEAAAEQLARSLVKDGYRKFEIVEG